MTIKIHNSELIKFLSITPDKEGNGAPVTLEYEYGILHFTYKKGGMLVKLPYTLNGTDEKWSINVDHTALMDAITSVKSKEDVNLDLVDGDLVIANNDLNIRINPWGKKIVDFDPDLLELDSQVIQFDGRRWVEFQAAARIAKFNKKGVNPEVVGKGVHCHFWGEYLTVSAWSKTVSCSRIIGLDGAYPVTEARDFILPLQAIDLVASMKPCQVVMTLDYKFQQLLIETDIGYVLVDVLQDKYPVADGIQKEFGMTVQVKRKGLLDAVKAAVEAGAKNVTLVFDNDMVIVEAAKTKKQEIPADLTDSIKQFPTAVTLTASALLEALKTVVATKILLHFSVVAANSLIIDTVTGVMYVLVVVVKTADQLVESAADVLKKPEPQREVVTTGTNSDGTPFVVETVEQSPLEEVLSIEEEEKKREELAQKYGSDKVELAEAVDTVTKLREKIKQIVKDIDSEITQIQEQQTNAVKQVSENPNFKDFTQEQDKPLAKYHQQLEELQLLKEKLTQVVTEAENAESILENYTHVYTLTIEKLKEISLKMLWWGGRTIEFLFKEEKTWHIQMKLISPRQR
jgi:hypothetical protein